MQGLEELSDTFAVQHQIPRGLKVSSAAVHHPVVVGGSDCSPESEGEFNCSPPANIVEGRVGWHCTYHISHLTVTWIVSCETSILVEGGLTFDISQCVWIIYCETSILWGPTISVWSTGSQLVYCLPKGRLSEGPHKIHLLCAQNYSRGNVGWRWTL